MSVRKTLRSAVVWFLAAGLSHAAPPEKRGVLVLAHGGGPSWNDTVRRVVDKAGLAQPVEIFYGMAVGPGEKEAMAAALASLRKKGAERVLAVPFLVSSHSEVYRQYQYMLGLRPEPGFSDEDLLAMAAMHHGSGAHAHHAMPSGPSSPAAAPGGPPVFLTGALDDSPEVLDALLDKARAVSRAPSKEAVLLVAHGPNGEEDNRLWLASLERLGAGLRAGLGFSGVRWATLRDDAPPAVKDDATRRLRADVEALSKGGKDVLVLPVLISAGGIEEGITDRLKGLTYRLAEPLGEHPALSSWISRQVREASAGFSVPGSLRKSRRAR